MSIEISAKAWTGEYRGLWSGQTFSGRLIREKLSGCVRAAVQRMGAIRRGPQFYRHGRCQFRVVKGHDDAHDVLCLQGVREAHYFLCPDHFREVIAKARIEDQYRYQRVRLPGWKARLYRTIQDRRGWQWAWVERPDWVYYFLMKNAYTDNPAREFRA